ncbi:MAG TPA: hypothetical protein PJ982_12810 [Lacipirellulaceae bacterium]|nr:hypothetical protein [Lacipirellulaceae bacterium]
MNHTGQYTAADLLHRLVKQAIDSGACASISEAESRFRRYRLRLSLPEDAANPAHQAALLTCVALARRVCLGGVTVDGALDVPLAVPMPLGRTLGDAVVTLGGVAAVAAPDTPMVTIGPAPQRRCDGFQVRTTYAGWRGGIVPAYAGVNPSGPKPMPLAPMLSAALAVNEAFLFMSTGGSSWGRRTSGMSMWDVRPDVDWLAASPAEPELAYLPSSLWLIGLGHLGQAYLWGLGLLPFLDASKLHLVLQDTDTITPSTESTSVLSDARVLGEKKTRAMATWAERRGFKTSIHERVFDSSFRRRPDEPAIALCGIDNALGRSALGKVGFDLVVEAGLGRGHRDFRAMRLHTLPCGRPATALWRNRGGYGEEVAEQEAYQRLMREGSLDRCGVTLLAGKAVGAPFVGAAAATLALSEVLRLLHGGPVYQLLDLDLLCIEHRSAVLNPVDFGRFNPGFVRAAA